MKAYFLLLFLVVVVPTKIAADDSAGGDTSTSESSPHRNMYHGTLETRKRLVATLFGDSYDPELIADNVRVNLSMHLQSFKVVAERNVLETDVWLDYEWKDERLQWDEEAFNGTGVMSGVNPKKVWTPDISLYNSADSANQMRCWTSPMVIFSDGYVSWVYPCKLESFCEFTPEGEQSCDLRFGSWTYDGNVLDLALKETKKRVQTDTLTNPPNWRFVASGAKRTSQIFPCCKEPYVDLTYTIVIEPVSDSLNDVEVGPESAPLD